MDFYKIIKENVIKEGVMIALIPFLATLNAFVFEMGYFRFFGIPYYFLELKITHIIIALFILIGFLLFYLTIMAKAAGYIQKGSELIQKITISVLGALILVVPVAALMPTFSWIIFGVMFFMFSIHFFISQEKKNIVEQTSVVSENHVSSFLSNLFGIFMISIFIICTSHLSGFYIAKLGGYWFDASKSDMLLVGYYGEHIIFKQVDLDKQILLDKVLILSGDEVNKLELEYRRLRVHSIDFEKVNERIPSFLLN